MDNNTPASSHMCRRRIAAVSGALAITLIVGFTAQQLLAPASSTFFSVANGGSLWAIASGEPTAADGVIDEGQELSVFDDEAPAITKLDPDLLAALRSAATDAAADGATFQVTSGWRSPAYQEQLLQNAIAEYGSRNEAARWVATPETSPHVSGEAVDIGSGSATDWLAQHGYDYGLCQTYDNEPWHYELRDNAAADGCPQMYPDPTHDPRMQQ